MHEIQSPDNNGIERLIKTVKADVAPRITPPALQAEIASVHYFTAADGVLGAQQNRVPVECPNKKEHASVAASSATTTAKDGSMFHCAHSSCARLGPNTLAEKASPSPTLGLITFCVIVMRNGFTVHGMSACASPENFNEQVGHAVARTNAEAAMWPLLGYALKEKLWQDKVNNTLVENLKGAKPCES